MKYLIGGVVVLVSGAVMFYLARSGQAAEVVSGVVEAAGEVAVDTAEVVAEAV